MVCVKKKNFKSYIRNPAEDARMSFICHIHNYTEYNEEWNVFSAFNPSKCTHLEQWAADCAAPGEQSWTSCWSRDSNPQPWVTSGFKSNALSIRPTTAQMTFHSHLKLAILIINWYPSQKIRAFPFNYINRHIRNNKRRSRKMKKNQEGSRFKVQGSSILYLSHNKLYRV